MNVDTDIILDYCRRFLGYGSFDSPIWTVGLEEGVPAGNSALAEISERLELWSTDVRPELWDLPRLHRELEASGISQPQFFSPCRPKYAPTWSALIRTILVAGGARPPIALEAIRDFQVNKLGRPWGPALIELLPLANHNIRAWAYTELSNHRGLEFLASRASYEEEMRRKRGRLILEKIRQFQPRAVLLYGNNAKTRELWTELLSQRLLPLSGLLNVLGTVVGETKVVLARHPASGVPCDTYERIGSWLRDGKDAPAVPRQRPATAA